MNYSKDYDDDRQADQRQGQPQKLPLSIAGFLRVAVRVVSKVIVDLTLVTRMFSDLLDRIRDSKPWWQQGIGPDSEGVYPENIFSQRWDNDDPPSFDLSA